MNPKVSALQKKLPELGVDGFLMTDPIDLYYFTGKDLSAGQLLVTPQKAVLIVDGRYFEACKSLRDVEVLLIRDKILEELAKDLKTIALDSEKLNLATFMDFEKQLGKERMKPLKGIVNELRAVKSAEELTFLKKAAELNCQGLDYAVSLLKEGVTEREIALELEYFWRKAGASAPSFPPIVAFGKESALPHYRAGDNRLKRNTLVLIDIGVTLNHYTSDMTRVVFFGDVDPELVKIHGVVEEALKRAEKGLKSGVKAGEIDQIAREYIASQGFGDKFIHSLGHGVGLEVHEIPVLRKTSEMILKEQMVVTIEPGVYIPGLGGVRLEDTVVVTRDGYQNLTERPYTLYA